MKRTISLLLSALMLVSCLAGCARKDPEPTQAAAGPDPTKAPVTTKAPEGQKEEKPWLGEADGKTPITLRLWAGVQPEYGYADIEANFNEQFKDQGLQVEFTRYKNDTDGNLQVDTKLMNGGEIDVLVAYGGRGRLNPRAESGLLLDMAPYMKESGFDIAKELGAAAASSNVNPDGTIYGVNAQFGISPWMIINEDMFKAAGIPIPYEGWTYSEFIDAAKKLTTGEGDSKVYGLCWGMNFSSSSLTTNISSVMNERQYFTDDTMTETTFTEPVWVEGVKLCKDTIDQGWAMSLQEEMADNVDVGNTFLTGKCAMFVTQSQLRLCMDTENFPHDFMTGFVPFPVPDDAQYNTPDYRMHASHVGMNDLVCISSKTKYPDQAYFLAEWYLKGGNLPLLQGGRYPLWTGVTEEEILQVVSKAAEGTVDEKCLATYLSVNRDAIVTVPSHPSKKQIGDILWEEIQNVLYDKKTVEQGMADVKSRSDELLKQG